MCCSPPLIETYLPRIEALSRIERFSEFPTVMDRRKSVAEHLPMVARISLDMYQHLLGEGYSFESGPEWVRTLALVHDDEEIWRGEDVSAWRKFTAGVEEHARYQQEKAAAITYLEERFGPVLGERYVAALREMEAERTLESQLVSYADKCSGRLEALHEASQGNELFRETVLPRYDAIFSTLPLRYDRLDFLRESDHVLNYCTRKISRQAEIFLELNRDGEVEV